MSTEESWVPEDCALPSDERPTRAAELNDLFANAVRGHTRAEPHRISLTVDPAWETFARDLAGREARCCSFFTFTFRTEPDAFLMDIAVPDRYRAVVDGIAERVVAARDD